MNVAKLIQFWSQIRDGLIETVEKFSDDDLNYTAVENGYSVKQLILHIAHEEYGEIQYGLTRKIDEFSPPFRDEEYQNLESLKSLLANVHSETIDYLENLNGNELEADVCIPQEPGAVVPHAGICAGAVG
jgi:uncharacterized damage-inducible protein DinB